LALLAAVMRFLAALSLVLRAVKTARALDVLAADFLAFSADLLIWDLRASTI